MIAADTRPNRIQNLFSICGNGSDINLVIPNRPLENGKSSCPAGHPYVNHVRTRRYLPDVTNVILYAFVIVPISLITSVELKEGRCVMTSFGQAQHYNILCIK